MPRKRRDVPWLATRNGVFYACWSDVARKRVQRLSLGTTDAREARARFAAFLASGTSVYQSEADALTCGRALDAYLVEHIAVKAADPERAEHATANLRVHFGDVFVSDVNIPMCRDYAAARQEGRIGGKSRGKTIRVGSASTVRRELGVLTAAIAHAVRWKRLQRNDVPHIELPPESAPRERWLTHGELAKLREKAAEHAPKGGNYARVRDFIEIAYYTGSRRAAVERMTWFQVRLDEGRIALAKAGEKATKKRRPVVPIDPRLKPLLERLNAAKNSEFVLGTPAPLVREFIKVAEAAGLIDVTPHTLRHTRATHLLQAGADPWQVAALLGDTLSTVVKTYAHHCPNYLAGVLSKTSEGE